ncbi:MAG: oxetanocin resistance protein [Propionibacteriaceae bacterium]|nr:oxetanocin resistance protein [Propionibacteriaceae bacterium]
MADCERCFGLCCVALPFAASADFAFDKRAGEPCRNLQSDFRCGIHSRLRQGGFAGCTVYDCFGAGQQVSQVTFGGEDWRQDSERASRMFEVFPVMRQLHELLWLLGEALTRTTAEPLHRELDMALQQVEELTQSSAADLVELDLDSRRRDIGALLRRTSALVRAEVLAAGKELHGDLIGADLNGADLIGADLNGADLRGADLRGAYLIAADLRGADLRMADLLGADLRDAELGGADLIGCIFLTQTQLNAARGDGGTSVPPTLTRPDHWSP